jgi:S-adenosylmethionine decarboxylase proenzyme
MTTAKAVSEPRPVRPRRNARAKLMRPYLGTHVLGEFFDCENLPNDVPTIQEHMENAARLIGATIVQSVFHEFSPYGLSGVVVIAESHLSVHTWPEYRCACVDVFTCSSELRPQPAFEHLKEVFRAGTCTVVEVTRGGERAPAPTS